MVQYSTEWENGIKGQVLSSTSTGTTDLDVNQSPIQLTTNTYMADFDDGTILVQPAANTQIILPTPTSAENGIRITVKRADAYLQNGPTLQVNSTASMDGTNSLNLNLSYQGYTFQAMAGNWHIIERF